MNENSSFLVLFLAPVKEYLADDQVSEILINGPSQIYIERNGKLEETPARFANEAQLKAAAVNIAKSVDRQLDEMHPDLDARLPDGSRVHATIPPISRCGTILSIRKFKKEMLTIDRLEQFGSIPREGVLLLNAIVKLRKNTIVSGGTSSGKTSVLNALSGLIPENDRILVLEDASELQLQQKHCVYFETRKPDKNGLGEFSIRDLVIASLRLRPDRLVIGEIRGGEALDLLQAMNTGHSGSMSTIHANSPLDALSRMETCAILSGANLPLTAIRMQVASAINCVVHTMRLPDGSRKIVEIAEVLPLENGEYRLRSLMHWETRSVAPDGSVSGGFILGERPTFQGDAELLHLELPEYR
ncbi:CpaF family protein [uncultured Victivallis sp.]|uniref:CpaF family protein n=1 Tax=uncultured Victivallis sp. TaxID=354118 RepID=UPI0025FECACD|nr:CpaF family protein [uncultured Victivallis sp.]